LYGKLLAIHPAMWTNGPSFPKLMPLLSMQIIPKTLANKVFFDNIPGSFTPAIIAFIYGIPLPAAAALI
jgi:hypothetical protein